MSKEVDTFEGWKIRGRIVIKGEHGIKDKDGKYLFTLNQTKPYKPIYRIPAVYETEKNYSIDLPPKRTYYADGSSEVNYGGPCGPMYFDRNGDS